MVTMASQSIIPMNNAIVHDKKSNLLLFVQPQHGESEKLVKALFAVARDRQPSIIFIGKILLIQQLIPL